MAIALSIGPAPSRPQADAHAVFFEAMSLLASGLSVVTAADAEGAPSGLLITSLCSYSAHPPSVLVCVRNGGHAHRALIACRQFGVHLLASDQEAVARAFSSPGRSKFARVQWAWDDDVPRVSGVIAYLRCRRCVVFAYADHAVVIGEVVDGCVVGSDPLCYLRRTMDWRLQRRSC